LQRLPLSLQLDLQRQPCLMLRLLLQRQACLLSWLWGRQALQHPGKLRWNSPAHIPLLLLLWWALLLVLLALLLLVALGTMLPWRWRGRRRLLVRLPALTCQLPLHALQAQKGGQHSVQAVSWERQQRWALDSRHKNCSCPWTLHVSTTLL
jgi:hypothetical protein